MGSVYVYIYSEIEIYAHIHTHNDSFSQAVGPFPFSPLSLEPSEAAYWYPGQFQRARRQGIRELRNCPKVTILERGERGM